MNWTKKYYTPPFLVKVGAMYAIIAVAFWLNNGKKTTSLPLQANEVEMASKQPVGSLGQLASYGGVKVLARTKQVNNGPLRQSHFGMR